MDITKFTPEQLALFTPEQLSALMGSKPSIIEEDVLSEQTVKNKNTLGIAEWEALSKASEDKIEKKLFASKIFSDELKVYLEEQLTDYYVQGKFLVFNHDDLTIEKIIKQETKLDRVNVFQSLFKFKSVEILNIFTEKLLYRVQALEQIICEPKDRPGCINLWRQNQYKPVECVEGFEHIKFLIERIFGKDGYEFGISFIKGCKDYVEHDKIPVVSSSEGFGKGVFRRLMAMVMHKTRVYEGKASVLTAPWNDVLLTKSLIFINEISKDEFMKVSDWLKDATGKNDINITKRFMTGWSAPRIQHYMIFTNKSGLENFTADNQRRYTIMDRQEEGKLEVDVMNKFGITVNQFLINMEEEMYNFSEFLADRKVTYASIQTLSETVINKKENTGCEFIRALAENDDEALVEIFHKFPQYKSNTFIDNLLKHIHEEGNPISTATMNRILMDIQPTYIKRNQLKSNPYLPIIEEYFDFVTNRTHALCMGDKTESLYSKDKPTKTSLHLKVKEIKSTKRKLKGINNDIDYSSNPVEDLF